MIIPMKKAFLYGLAQDADQIINGLMKLGCAQISCPEEMTGSEEIQNQLQQKPADLYDLEQKYSRLAAAISALKPYLPKGGLFSQKPRESFRILDDPQHVETALEMCIRDRFNGHRSFPQLIILWWLKMSIVNLFDGKTSFGLKNPKMRE